MRTRPSHLQELVDHDRYVPLALPRFGDLFPLLLVNSLSACTCVLTQRYRLASSIASAHQLYTLNKKLYTLLLLKKKKNGLYNSRMIVQSRERNLVRTENQVTQTDMHAVCASSRLAAPSRSSAFWNNFKAFRRWVCQLLCSGGEFYYFHCRRN